MIITHIEKLNSLSDFDFLEINSSKLERKKKFFLQFLRKQTKGNKTDQQEVKEKGLFRLPSELELQKLKQNKMKSKIVVTIRQI